MVLQLRPYQQQAVDALFSYWEQEDGNPLIDLATGCHAAGTHILMHDGTTKPVEMVAANDNVMGPDSKPRRVLRTVAGREMMYRVTPTKGEPFVVNEGHILSLRTTNSGTAKTKYPSGVRGGVIESISVRDWAGKAKSWKHLRKLWRSGVDFHANDNELEIPAWELGVLLGDGCLIYGVSLTNPDEEVLEPMREFAASLGLRIRESRKPNNAAIDLHFVDDEANSTKPNRLVQRLRDIGAFGSKADNKSVPHVYKCGSRHTRLEILAGLLDTDGHLGQGTAFDFISKSRQLSEDVVFLSRSLGLAAYRSECQKFCQTGGGGTYWRVCITGDVDIIPTRVKRKQAAPRRQIKNPLVTGFTAEPIGEGDFYGFTLDGDHLYLTADFTVHHNCGKSLVMADVTQKLAGDWGLRVVVATHVAELIEQNYLELLGVWPFAPAGILSAGVGRRQYDSQILFAGIQTAWGKVDRIGHVDVLMVDEAHLIPQDGATMYGKFIAALREVNPDLKIVGLTATPYRLKTGRLDEGDDRLFDRVVYTYGIGDGIRDGYLAPLSSKQTSTEFDLGGVGKLGGDYKQSALQAAVDRADVTKAAVAEIVAKGGARRSWLCFCAGVEHALHVRDEVRSHGITCETITGETPKEERRRILADFKAYRVRCLTNNAVLTTGFNHPGVDLIAAMRGTLSASLYVQMMGRGTRPIYAPGADLSTVQGRLAGIAAGPKPNCLVLDFAGLVDEHGPVDRVQVAEPTSGTGEAPFKLCPDCEEKCHASARECPACGHEFPPSEEPKHRAASSDAPIISTQENWRSVTGRTFREHPNKDPTKPPSVRVDYMLGYVVQKDWLCPEHTGYPKTKADRYWAQHGGQRPFPQAVKEWLDRADELVPTAEIRLKQNGKYWNVDQFRAGGANDNYAPVANDNVQAVPTDDWADDIPF